jgi:hypothetical protein
VRGRLCFTTETPHPNPEAGHWLFVREIGSRKLVYRLLVPSEYPYSQTISGWKPHSFSLAPDGKLYFLNIACSGTTRDIVSWTEEGARVFQKPYLAAYFSMESDFSASVRWRKVGGNWLAVLIENSGLAGSVIDAKMGQDVRPTDQAIELLDYLPDGEGMVEVFPQGLALLPRDSIGREDGTLLLRHQPTSE